MLRRTVIAAPLAALAIASAMPATAAAVPVPMGTCPAVAPAAVAQPALPCLPQEERGSDPLALVAHTSAGALWRFWTTAAFMIF